MNKVKFESRVNAFLLFYPQQLDKMTHSSESAVNMEDFFKTVKLDGCFHIVIGCTLATLARCCKITIKAKDCGYFV